MLELIAEHDLVLATGHVSPAEGLLLIQEARRLSVRHIVVTHSLDTGWTVSQMQEAAQAGAFIEFAKPLGRLPIEQYVDAIGRSGHASTSCQRLASRICHRSSSAHLSWRWSTTASPHPSST